MGTTGLDTVTTVWLRRAIRQPSSCFWKMANGSRSAWAILSNSIQPTSSAKFNDRTTDSHKRLMQMREHPRTELASFLRVEAKVRAANDDGISELLDEAAEAIEKMIEERLILDRRIHNQRRALRENWTIVEMRAGYKSLPTEVRSRMLSAWGRTARALHATKIINGQSTQSTEEGK